MIWISFTRRNSLNWFCFLKIMVWWEVFSTLIASLRSTSCSATIYTPKKCLQIEGESTSGLCISETRWWITMMLEYCAIFLRLKREMIRLNQKPKRLQILRSSKKLISSITNWRLMINLRGYMKWRDFQLIFLQSLIIEDLLSWKAVFWVNFRRSLFLNL